MKIFLGLVAALSLSTAFSSTESKWDELLGSYSRVEFRNGLDNDDQSVTDSECPLEIDLIADEGGIAISTAHSKSNSGRLILHSWEKDNSCREWDHYVDSSVHEERCNKFSDKEIERISSTSTFMYYSGTNSKLKISKAENEIIFSKNYLGLALNPLNVSQTVKCKYKKI